MDEFKKEVIEYAEKYTSAESDVLRQLREHCYAHYEDKAMLSGFVQGRVLATFAKMIKPRRVLEIGTYLGYSALCFAEGLAEDGKVITIDVNEDTNRVAREFAARTEYASKIDFRLGDALDIIPTLEETLDLVFIDADKPNYVSYYEAVLPRLSERGFIAADNTLWSGHVLDESDDEGTRAIKDFNEHVKSDARVTSVMLTVRDGVTLIRPKA